MSESQRQRESSSGCITQQRGEEKEKKRELSFLAFVPARVSSESNKLESKAAPF